jgi:hypothetical protein
VVEGAPALPDLLPEYLKVGVPVTVLTLGAGILMMR